ncbi:uncharacterized protein L1281_002210 [Neisseria sp. HSC-16F19]|nr:TPM domain-containing protein [Neisseria sp. HSC-16F19]MCP2041601.1 uncharacterized protein [Neisseria sp. HSC-16F19]
MTLRSCLAALWLCLFSPWLWAQTAVPALTAPVTDTAQMMQPQARAELNRHLLDYARQNGSQIVVLTVDAIAPETPFDYATRVMDAWKPGRAGVDDGVLLLLVKNERKTHLAVGSGLEGAIPDAYAKRILDDVLRPYLQQGRMDEGITAAVVQIEKLIAGEELPPPQSWQGGDDDGFDRTELLPMAIMFAFMVGQLLRAAAGRLMGSAVAGGIMLVAGWLVGFGWLFSVILAVGVAVFVSRGTAFVGGSGGGSWGGGSSSGSGGGGFSGGGGGFRGGGASGGW